MTDDPKIIHLHTQDTTHVEVEEIGTLDELTFTYRIWDYLDGKTDKLPSEQVDDDE